MKRNAMELEVGIATLGDRGDGVADGPDGPIYVPFTLPGEKVTIALEEGEDRAALLEVIKPSPDRVAPVCRYFGTCGGCALQHMEREAYLDWKREHVVAALQAGGLRGGRGGQAGALGQQTAGGSRPWPHQAGRSAWLSPSPLPRSDRRRRLSGPDATHLRQPAEAQGGASAAAGRRARGARQRNRDFEWARHCARGGAALAGVARGVCREGWRDRRGA